MDFKTKVTVNRRELYESVDRAALISRESKNSPIRLEIGEESIVITSNAENGTSREEVGLVLEGGGMKCAYTAAILDRMMDDQAEALEFKIRDNFTNTDIPLSQLPLKKGVLVGGINRNGKIILPRGSDVIRKGDTVVIITTLKGLNDISDVLE